MFGSNKKNPSSQNLSSVDTELVFDNKKPTDPKSIPIHTMKKDLQNINNPQYFNEPDNAVLSSSPIGPALSSKAPDSKLRTSPFLSQNSSQAPANNVPPATPTNNVPEKINVSPAPHTTSSWAKLILITCVIFLLFAAGGGGYYFWMNKKSTAKTPQDAGSTVIVPPKSTLATDKPNYLNIDASAEKIDLASATDKYIKEIGEEKPATSVEFIVVDNQNNPIPFKDFTSKSGIAIPEDMMDKLKENFSLFIYLDEGRPRIGLSVASNDLIGTNLKQALAKNEPTMISFMEPLYLSDSPIASDDNEFSTSYYGGAEIRFKNIEPSDELSMDYTIFRDKLVIGTSKMTARAIIDYLTVNGKVQGVEDTIEGIPEESLQNGVFNQ